MAPGWHACFYVYCNNDKDRLSNLLALDKYFISPLHTSCVHIYQNRKYFRHMAKSKQNGCLWCCPRMHSTSWYWLSELYSSTPMELWFAVLMQCMHHQQCQSPSNQLSWQCWFSAATIHDNLIAVLLQCYALPGVLCVSQINDFAVLLQCIHCWQCCNSADSVHTESALSSSILGSAALQDVKGIYLLQPR